MWAKLNEVLKYKEKLKCEPIVGDWNVHRRWGSELFDKVYELVGST